MGRGGGLVVQVDVNGEFNFFVKIKKKKFGGGVGGGVRLVGWVV